jgi:hypothetical protein
MDYAPSIMTQRAASSSSAAENENTINNYYCVFRNSSIKPSALAFYEFQVIGTSRS